MSVRKTKPLGHSAHTQDAAAAGLAGTMDRPIKLTFLGAGSFFAPRLVNDVVRIPGNRGGTIALVDIDEGRLDVNARLIRRLLTALDRKDWKVETSTDRAVVISGSD